MGSSSGLQPTQRLLTEDIGVIRFGADVGPLEMLTISTNSTSLVALPYGSGEQAPFTKATPDGTGMAQVLS